MLFKHCGCFSFIRICLLQFIVDDAVEFVGEQFCDEYFTQTLSKEYLLSQQQDSCGVQKRVEYKSSSLCNIFLSKRWRRHCINPYFGGAFIEVAQCVYVPIKSV